MDLSTLSPAETAFYRQAYSYFKKGMDWRSFHSFAFGLQSPIYANRRSQKEVTARPLFLALRDMWLQLGINQKRVAPWLKVARREIA